MYSKPANNNRLPFKQKQTLGANKAIFYLLRGAKVLVLAQITPSDTEQTGEDPRPTLITLTPRPGTLTLHAYIASRYADILKYSVGTEAIINYICFYY